MAATFAAPRFEKFIPYTPPEPKTARRPPPKEARACSPEWLDIDNMINALNEQGDKFIDTLAAMPPLDALKTGSQSRNTQNVLEDIEYDESNNATSDSGTVSETAAASIPILSPADDALGLHVALGAEEEGLLAHHDHRAESPRSIVDLLDDNVEDAVVQLAPMSECRDSTPLADATAVLLSANEQQDMDNARPGASNNAVDPEQRLGEVAGDSHIESGDARSPSQCSIADLGSPPPSDDSTFEARPSGTSFRESSDDEVESCQPKPASRQRKPRRAYSHERVTPPGSNRQRSWRIRKLMRPRRLPQVSSKMSDWAIRTDAPQIPPDFRRTCGDPMPQKLVQVNLRQLPSGETFMAAVIQDERKVAAFAYDQSVKLLKRSIGCDRKVDGLGIMSISLNSWLLTGFLRMDHDQDPHLPARSGCFANDEIDESPVERICAPSAELDRLTDLLHEPLSPDDDGSIEDDLQPSDDEKPRDMTRHRKPPWTSKEEQVLAENVDHKSWKEIGDLLGRPPGGVSQRWRKMQLAAAGPMKPHLKSTKKKKIS